MTAPARKKRKKRRYVVGAAPGTLNIDPDAPPSKMHVIAYDSEKFVEQDIADVAALRELRKTWPMVWLNIDGLGDEKTIKAVGDFFALHPLSLEDVVAVRQRPKIEAYDAYLFMVLRMVDPGKSEPTDQMSLFLGDGYVVTFQEFSGDCFDGVRDRIRKGGLQKRSKAPDYLAYALIDALIDHYFPTLEDIGERLDALQEAVITDPRPRTVAELNTLKHDLQQMRRAVWPLRDELNALLRDNKFFTPETQLYLRDCYDPCIALIDLIETLRETSGGLMDVYLSSVSNRTNEVMKVLTVVATIFMPLSFIAGVYGMNFNPQSSPYNMPELNAYWGYPASLLGMVVTTLLFVGYFWRKGWLGTPK